MERSGISAAKGRPAGNMDLFPEKARDLVTGEKVQE